MSAQLVSCAEVWSLCSFSQTNKHRQKDTEIKDDKKPSDYTTHQTSASLPDPPWSFSHTHTVLWMRANSFQNRYQVVFGLVFPLSVQRLCAASLFHTHCHTSFSLIHQITHLTCSVCVFSHSLRLCQIKDKDKDLRPILSRAIMSAIVFADNDKCEAAQIVTVYLNKSSNSCLLCSQQAHAWCLHSLENWSMCTSVN